MASTSSFDAAAAASSAYSSFDLSGKTALITGSSGGIGKAMALAFAEAGADVILHYNTRREGAEFTFREINRCHREVVKRIEEEEDERSSCIRLPGKCLGMIQADFRNSYAVDEMFHCVVNEITNMNNNNNQQRRLDILVNNAGIVTKLAMEDDDDESLSSYHETMAINLHAPCRLMRLAHRHMKSTSTSSSNSSGGMRGLGGVIINNTSIHGTRSVEYMTSYAASKAALESLTRGLALEYAPDNVRVNAIAPGVVPVERTAAIFDRGGVSNMWKPYIPLGRLGTVEDIAHATLLLATNEWMTGTILTVDGGMMARANMPIRPKPPPPKMKKKTGDRVDDLLEERSSSSTTGTAFEVPTEI
jgi:glucose 1-dehydrogenase